MSQSLTGKVFAITGGASGIGLATAKLLSSRGATVCIADVDAEAMESAEAYFSGEQGAGGAKKYDITKVDISKRAEVDAWIEGVVGRHGRLDGAANVAGIIGREHGKAAITEFKDEEWDRIIAVNMTGTMYCLRAELRRIVDGGSIVNVSSIHGLKGEFCSPPLGARCEVVDTELTGRTGFAYHAAYDASKHGVIGITRVAAQENGHREVRVNAVAPGAIYTPLMQKNWDLTGRPKDAPFDDPSAFRRLGTAEEVAAVIGFLLGPESKFVSGSVYSVDGAWQ